MTTALSTEDLALARGSLTNRGSDTFAWDFEERMTSATVDSVTTTFAYRGDGLRDSRTTGASTTTFTWDIAAGLPVVLDDGNQYIYGAGLEEMVSGGSRYYYLADGLGSTMAIVDSAGAVQKSYTYDVYGEATATGSLANEYDFAGQQTDPTGLQYLRARYMDPETGVFLSREPLAEDPDWLGHPVSYVEGNPCTLVDPTGLAAWGGRRGCDELWAEILMWIEHMEKKKDDYRQNLRNIPEWAPPGQSPYGHRVGHREAYAGYQRHMTNLLYDFDRNDCHNKKNRPKGYKRSKVERARILAKEYQPLQKIERDVEDEHTAPFGLPFDIPFSNRFLGGN